VSEGRLSAPVGENDHVDGPSGAAMTLVEYGDYECPSCGAAYPVVHALREKLRGRMRFVFRNFPLNESHEHAEHAAEAAEAVAATAGNEAFWRMHDALYQNQDELTDEDLARYAAKAGADADGVALAVESGEYRKRVRTDFSSGVRSGVSGTPTFFINGQRFDGNWQDEEAFASALEDAGRASS
jgi:protein-disulfide isomerase